MRLSVFYDHILRAQEQTGKQEAELFAEVRAAGIEAVEIELAGLLQDPGLYGRLRAAGLGVSMIYAVFDMQAQIGGDIPARSLAGYGAAEGGSTRESDGETYHVLEATYELADACVRKAVEVGCKKVLVVPGFFSREETEAFQRVLPFDAETVAFLDHNPVVGRMLEGLRMIVEMGRRRGVMITVEDYDNVSSPLCGRNGIRYFLERVPGLTYTLDMGNFVLIDENVMDAWEPLHGYLGHVHCKDRGEQSLIPEGLSKEEAAGHNYGMLPVAAGDGYMPLAALLKKVKGSGYDDYLAIEHFGSPQQERCMLRSAAYIKDIWDKA